MDLARCRVGLRAMAIKGIRSNRNWPGGPIGIRDEGAGRPSGGSLGRYFSATRRAVRWRPRGFDRSRLPAARRQSGTTGPAVTKSELFSVACLTPDRPRRRSRLPSTDGLNEKPPTTRSKQCQSSQARLGQHDRPKQSETGCLTREARPLYKPRPFDGQK